MAWLATVFGLRRVLGIPSLAFALVSLVVPFVHDYTTLIALSIAHGMLLGTFVPATLMIILRNLPIPWWLPAISIYAIRVGFAFDSSSSVVGLYVEHLGWVGFDPANGIGTTQAHVRVSVGLDYLGAAPVRGVRCGGDSETLKVSVYVDQASRQTQS